MGEQMVIIGAGQCGARAAAALRERGWSGEIILVSEEFEPPYERPPLSKSALTTDREPTPKVIVPPEHIDRLGITLITGVRAESINRDKQVVELSDGRAIDYHRVLLATGSRARSLPTPRQARSERSPMP